MVQEGSGIAAGCREVFTLHQKEQSKERVVLVVKEGVSSSLVCGLVQGFPMKAQTGEENEAFGVWTTRANLLAQPNAVCWNHREVHSL